ncbi:hypothetical protein CEV33_1731 [Brucella grignonensis]|uniref:Uncharacterized protein n=1 Tax=Brucella grignonensis TaxID=94627 RepID=A0A256F9Y8_9HYPH|nr:hypothetical protein CEV33_1731 [Brucella grignonensis]
MDLAGGAGKTKSSAFAFAAQYKPCVSQLDENIIEKLPRDMMPFGNLAR